jgi:hypothetical protein
VKDSNQQEKSNQYRGPDRLTFTIGTEGEIDIAAHFLFAVHTHQKQSDRLSLRCQSKHRERRE